MRSSAVNVITYFTHVGIIVWFDAAGFQRCPAAHRGECDTVEMQ